MRFLSQNLYVPSITFHDRARGPFRRYIDALCEPRAIETDEKARENEMKMSSA